MKENKEYRDVIDLERGRAIDAFAKLESTLCWLLSEVGNLEFNTAATVFYSNISLQPRIEIISAILEEYYNDKFNIFWGSVRKAIDSLNGQRNKIVHWHSYPVYDGRKEFENTKFVLIHPRCNQDDSSEFSVCDIHQFIEKTEYLTNVIGRFRCCFRKGISILQQRDIELFSKTLFTFSPVNKDPFGCN
ncbi:hypothetical protein H5A34_14425 [Pectobacterium brasiliense]|uniref:hypothetical protein n=1 Tax=Pectobacterium brasiliense TaxID=180957 RepID=UPI0019691864|nr:hypothetical protein [Pectobacterium brasiliense]MBN3069410.1 hypothetical protein [Pectobacterium brasiliense]MBN3247340.1 hypothetical protein [Pectobacterium brasiliense]